MSRREPTRDEEERDDYVAAMLQHADDLGLIGPDIDPSLEFCEKHGTRLPSNPMLDCPDCAVEEYDLRHRGVDYKFFPTRNPAA
jgi:hypothetical protein